MPVVRFFHSYNDRVAELTARSYPAWQPDARRCRQGTEPGLQLRECLYCPIWGPRTDHAAQ